MPSGGSPDAADGCACDSEAWKQQSRRGLAIDSTTDIGTAKARPPKLPPRWFIRTFWRAHRALHRLSGGRFLWTTSSKRGWGAARLTTLGRKSGDKRTVIDPHSEQALVGQPLSEETIGVAAKAARRAATPMDNTDFQAQWRGVMVERTVERVLRTLI